MTIFLDVSAGVHRRAGLGRYAESLARALEASSPGRYSLFYNRERGMEPLADLEHLPSRTISLGYKPWRMLVWLGHLGRVGFDRLIPSAILFHATEHLLPPLRTVPTVLTVHDLIYHHLPDHHKTLNRWYLNLTMPLYCRRATHIIAVSEHTQRDLVATYSIPKKKISVIHEAADPRFRPSRGNAIEAVRSCYNLPERYILFVGTIEPRKNLSRLLHAFEVAHASDLTDGLVIVGQRGWLYDGFFANLDRSATREAVIFPGYVPDDLLTALYSGAQALILPSLHEGFGLPVLEAMACGTPVACSNSSSLPEIAGDAAVLFDPLDVESIIATLRRLLASTDLQRSLVQRGLERAAMFSWARAASQTESVYDLVLTRR